MRKTIALAACLSLLPVFAFAVGSGMGMYGTASFGGGGGGNATENAQEEYATAMRLMDKQDFENALHHLIRVNTIEQGNADVLNDIGYAARMTGDYETSAGYLQRAIARNPDLRIAYTNLGMVYLVMHQPDGARQQLGQLKHLCPGGCQEADELSQSIAAYDTAAKAPAASQGAAPQK
jgi:tetratricopeptide (TPR) repeat protein